MNFEWMANVPIVAGVVLHTLVWIGLVLWVLRRPAAEIYAGGPDRARWRDLRLWVLPLAIVQILLYLML